MKKKYRYVWAVILLLILGLVLLGCPKKEKEQKAKKAEADTRESKREDAGRESPEEGTTGGVKAEEEQIDDVTLDGMSRDILSGMSREEKVGQMLFVGLDTLRGDGKTGKLTKCSGAVKEKIGLLSPGGIILYSRNMKKQGQLKILLGDLQAASRIPLFLGAEEEGGTSCRIAPINGMGAKETKDAKSLGEAADEEEVQKTGQTIAVYMKELGFNLNFAPVADVAGEVSLKRLENRSFGEDADTVSLLVGAFVEGSQAEGVSAMLKYFPGQGALKEDTHKGAADLDKTIKELREKEFLPFLSGVEHGVDFIMVGHASCSKVTEDQTPASLSKLIVTDILRQELRFDSIILTDSMNMKAITETYSADDAAVRAVKAGADMILCPDNGQAAYDGIIEAVNTGKIEERRIDESVLRILKVKVSRGIIPEDTSLIDKKRKDEEG